MTLAERPFDLTRIAEVLERHGVLYVTIGGACGLLHGATEYLTKDVDVMARSDEGNRRRLAAALTELGARADGAVTADDLIGNTQWETGAGPIDVVITATGPDETVFMYADIQPRSVVYTLGGEGMRGGYSIVLPRTPRRKTARRSTGPSCSRTPGPIVYSAKRR